MHSIMRLFIRCANLSSVEESLVREQQFSKKYFVPLLLLFHAPVFGCKSRVEVETKTGALLSAADVQGQQNPSSIQSTPKPELSGLSHLVARAGEKVYVYGKNLESHSRNLQIRIGSARVTLAPSEIGNSLGFVMPEGLSPGLKEVALVATDLGPAGENLNGDFGSASLIFDPADLPIITLEPDAVCQGLEYRNALGKIITGSKDCSKPPLCTISGQSGCTNSGNFIGVSQSELLPTVIKTGVKVGGVIGNYPSEGNPLVGTDATPDLKASTFIAQLKSAGSFEFFGPDGTRYTASGDPNLVAGNILSGVSIFGVLGSVLAAPAPCIENNAVGCVTTPKYKSADWTNLTAANIKNGVAVAGLTGTYPSSSNRLAANTAAADLPSFGPATPIGVYEFFDSAGGVYSATVADGGTVTPGTSDQRLSTAGTMYRSATISGDADLTASKILSGVNLFGVTGTVTAAPANCSANGSQSCVATGTYFAATACTANSSNCFVPTYVSTSQPLKAVSYDAIDAGKGAIRSTLTLGGVTGTLVDCTTNNTSGCVTTSAYKSADWSNLTAANIKNGVSVAGLTGTYPSAGNLLSGADTTPDLDVATFDAKIKGSSSFEWFSSNGSRYTYAGDADIVAGNILSGITIFGTTGIVAALTQCTSGVQATCTSDAACRWNAGACEINPWHIRAGITVASKAGSLKTNCRNTINSTTYNWDGPVASLPNTGEGGGTSLDFWDSTDDDKGLSPTRVTGWSDNSQCDSSSWTDETTTDGATSFTTCGASSTCIYRDELSGLRVTGVLSSGTTTDTNSPATYTWSGAINVCASSTYGGYAAGTWRVPTQKELMTLYQNGIVSRVESNFHILSNLQNYYWSSSSTSNNTSNGWIVNLANGTTDNATKTNIYHTLCVF